MTQIMTENRALNRLQCSIAVSDSARSALLGTVEDISLDGLFILCDNPLHQGAVVPLALRLGTDGKEIRPEAEVVRQVSRGMGLRFLSMSQRDSRILRRYVADLLAIQGHRDATARLLDVESGVTEPIREAHKIKAILSAAQATSTFTLLPKARPVRELMQLVSIHEQTLQLSAQLACDLQPHEEVFVLCTHDFVSYSFRTQVIEVQGTQATLQLPALLQYSERRSSRRDNTTSEATLVVQVPWRTPPEVSWQIFEWGVGGLSFRADPSEVNLFPGSTLPRAVLRRPQQADEELENIQIRHVTMKIDDNAQQYLRVGISHGVERQSVQVRDESMQSDAPPASGALSKVVSLARDLAAKATYVYHRQIDKIRVGKQQYPYQVINFANRRGKPMVGLLNMAFSEAKKMRAPLVIIAPGFGARKETMSALAATLVHNFKHQHRDVAVLRFDGSNNLGESYKEPGCESEGKQTLKYTVSSGVDDILGAVAWAQNNKYIDATQITVISVSFSSVALRHALTLPQMQAVTHWICFMGAADASNAALNVAGNLDMCGNYQRGIKNGCISLLGCLTDLDNMAADMAAHNLSTLEDARREMALIRADITWVLGKHDAFMDPRRAQDIMSVKAHGKRHLIEVNAGHVPQSSDEALAEFLVITRHIWRHLYGRDITPALPSPGYLVATAAMEWQRVRSSVGNLQQWWHEYLLGDNGIGYDIWSFTPEYRQFVTDQVHLAAVRGKKVLDLGAGTGNVSLAILKAGCGALTAADLVPEALEKLRSKTASHGSVETVQVNMEGSARLALQRLLRADLHDFQVFSGRLPLEHQKHLQALAQTSAHNTFFNALLSGYYSDIDGALQKRHFQGSAAACLRDIHLLAQLCRGWTAEATALPQVTSTFQPMLQGSAGLPFADNAFDAIVCSIVLSYLQHPEDALAEMYRILKPQGRLVISSMLPDSDTSKTFVHAIAFLESAPAEQLPMGLERGAAIEALRTFLGQAANLYRLQEEGLYRFFTADQLSDMVLQAGFTNISSTLSLGDPAMACIVTCQRR